jgi:hypothetical protein
MHDTNAGIRALFESSTDVMDKGLTWEATHRHQSLCCWWWYAAMSLPLGHPSYYCTQVFVLVEPGSDALDMAGATVEHL